MLGTILDAGRSISIFPFWIFLPTILDRVVALHRWALLLADPIVVEVSTGLKCEYDNDDRSNNDFFHSLAYEFNYILIDLKKSFVSINSECHLNVLGNSKASEDI